MQAMKFERFERFERWGGRLGATCLIVAALAVQAEAIERNAGPRVAVPATAAPKVDGVIGADEWKDAVRMEGFCVYRQPDMLPADASFMVKQDGRSVYISARAVAPADGLKRRVMARPGSADAFADDCYEIVFFDDAGAQHPLVSHLYVNFNGAMMAQRRAKGQTQGWKAWETVVAKSAMKDGYWNFELAVPFSDIGFTAANATRHAIRICRNWWCVGDSEYAVQTSWTENDGPFEAVARAPRVEFRDDAPVVRCEKIGPDAVGSSYVAAFSVFNPGREVQSVDAFLRGEPVNSQPGERRETFRLAPGERREFSLAAAVLNDEKVSFEALFRKAGAAGAGEETVWYSRAFTFAPNAPRVKFRPKGGAGEATFKFAYFPSHDKARIVADVSNCRGKEKVTALTLSVRDAAGKELARLPLGAGTAADAIVGLPDLAALTRATGKEDYEAVLVAEGAPDIKASVKFKRGVFEWEGNKFGLSETVPAPFTPVRRERVGQRSEVRGQTAGEKKVGAGVGADHRAARSELEKVSVVLRDHIVDKQTGLWQQVTAAGKELLARPMALVDAKSVRVPVDAKSVRVPVDAVAHRVDKDGKDPLLTRRASASTGGRGKDSASTGCGEVTASTEWDVDGMMEWRLTLAPGHYEPMSLEIPVKGEIAKLYHSCADGLRYNPAGAIPAGTGRVWDSSLPPRTSIIGSYLPYIWIGGPLRGIAVFGENDKGWVLGGEQKVGGESRSTEEGKVPLSTSTSSLLSYSPPCQEIIREADGTVVLRLNLIQRAVDLTEPQTIRIGFQATPVKPMAEGWRAMSHGTLMASWFVYGVSAEELSPYDGKDTFLRKMGEARRTGKVDEEYLESYIRNYPSPWPEGSEKRKARDKFLATHWRAGMNRSALSHKTGGLHVFYTNPRAVPLGMPPGTTYGDEWDRQPWTVRGGNRESGHAYDLDPVASYRDYAAWWYERMIATGAADAIYWDNVFCQSDFNLVGTDAYRHPSGNIQPASGIFEMRALIRRCAVVMAELGKTPRNNWVHMTNTAMAPICGFAGVDYDWEDTAGDTAIQERYSREYVQAASLGRQFGNRVGVMGYFANDFLPAKDRDLKKQAWLHRTGTGACLTHEFQWRRVPAWQTAIKRLNDWGYTNAATKVWNYWDEDVAFPAAITGGENAALAMSKPTGGAVATVGADHRAARGNGALVIVSDWKDGGDYAIRPDVAALGLAKDFRAVDFETGRELPVSDGCVSVKLDRFDYVMIELK